MGPSVYGGQQRRGTGGQKQRKEPQEARRAHFGTNSHHGFAARQKALEKAPGWAQGSALALLDRALALALAPAWARVLDRALAQHQVQGVARALVQARALASALALAWARARVQALVLEAKGGAGSVH